MAYKFILGDSNPVVENAEMLQGIKSVRLARVIMATGFNEVFRVPDTLKTDADISDWIEKQASLKETEMAASIKTSALKV